MAVEKIYQPYDEATQTSIPQRQPQSSPEKQTVKRKVVVQLTRFENILYMDQKIEKQSSENSALKSEIKKNSSYERIYDKAKKQGMSLENDNVKVVRNNGEAKN